MSIADTSQRPLTRDAEPSPHVVPAGTRALLATLMDVLAALVPLLAVPLLGRTRLPLACAWTSAGVLVILVAAALIADLCRTGRTPGRRLLGVRTVAAATGLPPTLREVVRRQHQVGPVQGALHGHPGVIAHRVRTICWFFGSIVNPVAGSV